MIWVGRLIAIAVVLQTLEQFWIRPWPWNIIVSEIPPLLRPFLESNKALLTVRLISALMALAYPNAWMIAVLLLSTWLLNLRWRGTFNGGSDIMTVHILIAWWLSQMAPRLERACLFYIAAQIILSYFVAGLGKLCDRHWREGGAVTPIGLKYGWNVPMRLGAILGGLLILFEISFPLALWWPLPFLALGLLFHFLNAYALRLNRFFFVWLAGYPALWMVFKLLEAQRSI